MRCVASTQNCESTGTSWYLTIVHPAPYSIYIYWYIWVLGAPYKRGSTFSYIDCYTPTLFWRPMWDVWQVRRMGESTGTSWYLTIFHPAPYYFYIYWYIWVSGGALIKEGLILVFLIVTLQNCFGDLGEMCGKYSWWVKVPGPLDIWPFFTQLELPIIFTYIDIYGFWGPLIKEGLILVISIVALQNYFSDLCEMCGKYAGWVKVPGPLDICQFFTQLPILFTYIDIYGFWGAPYKRGPSFSYLDCYTPKLF